MAEGLLKRLVGVQVFVDSCGLRRMPASFDDEDEPGVDPLAAEVMSEVGCDIRDHHAKTFEQLEDGSFDVVISLTPEAQHRAVELARGRAVASEYWPTHDPTLAEGSREARLEAYRAVRDTLARRIQERFGAPSPST